MKVRISIREHIQKLDDNLIMSISLTDFIGKILEQVSLLIGDSSIRIFGSIFKELPVCFYLTYKHCKESQEKYQNLRKIAKKF
ncbi:hypothetical protein HHI36_001246 [Cryptolaemus montrouzieri]|uniref:Uncharacterized protein n=1 Tax=Cryptolaemus montrouzieri TaxID=559131 RepID=A0ABD2P704_9CUCU